MLQSPELFPLLLIHPFIRPSVRSFIHLALCSTQLHIRCVIQRTVCTSIPNFGYLFITLYFVAASVKLFYFLAIALFYNIKVS
jgi:endonuclease/exonuclease/phosphatase (EEP) superfamily protein YafD